MLKDFLEAILNIHINKVEVKNPELTPNMADEKLGILDLKLDIDNERVVDVEMQVSNEHNIKERSSTYLSKLAAEQLKAKQNYKELKKIITINILKYNYLERNSYHSIARMKYEDTNPIEFVDMGYKKEEEEATNTFEMHFIELPKFKEKNPDCNTKLEQWLWLIDGSKEEKVEMSAKENEEINKTVKDMLNGQELKPFVEVDLKLSPSDITEQLVNDLEIFEPFGAANPNPVFAVENLVVKEKKVMGKDSTHLKLICDAGGHELTCIWWQKGDIMLNPGDVLDVLFHPNINEFNGNTYLQLIIQDAHSDAIEYEKDVSPATELKFFDHRKKTNILPMVDDYVKTSKLNIKVFAESKAVIDALKPYKSLTERIFNRNNPEICDAVMFFDYPADKLTLCDILEKTSASTIHLMGYDVKHLSQEELVVTAFKMLKYAANYSHGEVELYKFASFLGKSNDVLGLLFSMFEEIGLMKILSHNDKAITVALDDTVNPAKILHCADYSALAAAANDCEEFQTFLMNEDLDKVQELFT
mgnify:CR=1 FL=1